MYDSLSHDPDQVVQAILADLRSRSNADNVAGMARFGISPEGTLGIGIPVLRGVARELRPLRRSDPQFVHAIADALWRSGIHEARILASFVDVPELVTTRQAENWVADLDSWDVCDQLMGLFASASFAYDKADQWSRRHETFVKRAGFVLMATLAVHDKKAPDSVFTAYLPVIERECTDERNFVKKAVNWALRQIGKRSAPCNAAAIQTAERILEVHSDSATARWIARDALRELRSEAVRARLAVD